MYYLKLYYKLLDWEWYTNANVMRLFIHCLLKANRQTKKWQGITIKAGSFVTSYEHLAVELGLTVRQVRTALDKLKMTKELTHKGQAQYSIITVNNWNDYQVNDKQNDKQMTNKRQTNDKQMTTTRECNNDIECKNVISINAEKTKKTDPYTNDFINEFKILHKKIMGKRVYLSKDECFKLTELAADVEDFSSTLPNVLEKLKNLKFERIGYNPNASWLLKENHYTEILNGAYDDIKNIGYKSAAQRKADAIERLGR